MTRLYFFKSPFFIAFFIGAGLLILSVPINAVSAEPLQQEATPTVTITAPPPYQPDVNLPMTPMDLSCPGEKTPVAGWGTVTPDSAWMYLCSQCVVTPMETSTPQPQNTLNPTQIWGTHEAELTATSTPQATVTSISTPVVTSTSVPTPIFYQLMESTSINSGGEGSYNVHAYFGELPEGYTMGGGSEWGSLGYQYLIGDLTGLYFDTNDSDDANAFQVICWGNGVRTYYYDKPEFSLISNYSEGCRFLGQSNGVIPLTRVTIWKYGIPPTPDVTPTPTPEVTPTPEPELSYCQTVSNNEQGFSWEGISYGEISCFDIGPYDLMGYWAPSADGEPRFGEIPWIAHICMQDISFGKATIFNVEVSLQLILYTLGIALVIRNMFVS